MHNIILGLLIIVVIVGPYLLGRLLLWKDGKDESYSYCYGFGFCVLLVSIGIGTVLYVIYNMLDEVSYILEPYLEPYLSILLK